MKKERVVGGTWELLVTATPLRVSFSHLRLFQPWGVRYQVTDIERSVVFYAELLQFKVEQRGGSAFAKVSCGHLAILLSGPGSSGARPMPDGRRQEQGGWNRVILRVDDLPARIVALRAQGVRFRNDIESGPGGRQIQLEDADGNPIELFEPAAQT